MSDTANKTFKSTREQTYEASRRAVAQLGYNILASDQAGFTISFNTGRSWKTWGGQDLTATVFSEGSGSRLVVGGCIAKVGNPFGGNQLTSWGEKGALIKKFLQLVEELLPSVQAPEIKPTGGKNAADEIRKLLDLKKEGALTDEEFQKAKSKLLAS